LLSFAVVFAGLGDKESEITGVGGGGGNLLTTYLLVCVVGKRNFEEDEGGREEGREGRRSGAGGGSSGRGRGRGSEQWEGGEEDAMKKLL